MLAAVSGLCAESAWGQANRGGPHIGYVYPAGGRRGDTFEVLVGGQALRGAGDVYISGEGVRAKVVQYYRPMNNLPKEQRDAIVQRLRELMGQRLAELPRADRPLPPELQEILRTRGGPLRAPRRDQAATQPAALPEHPLLRNLEGKSLRELLHVRNELLSFRKRQPNPQIAESVLIEVTIDRNAPTGDREIRLGTMQGLTNPLVFEVGALPEVSETEPNDPRPIAALLPGDAPLELPVLINGQVKPGDVDRFRFKARRGQQLEIQVHARRLIPYLADAVPGWFQATLALYDADGREVAFADDYRFDPDPVLLYKVPQDGEYQLEIRDSIYRGREDFVYRVAVGERAAMARALPLAGQKAIATASRKAAESQLIPGSGTWPEGSEAEPNDDPARAQRIELPLLVAGRIGKAGDVDVFQFEGRAGEEIVAEIYARRLHSPVDSLVRLTGASGQVLAWNDDHEDKASGLITHHADSYLRVKLPADGCYRLSVSDAQRQGGFGCDYLLRIGPPRPDFALRLTPSSINVRAGGAEPVCVHVVRKDGFEGPIEVVLKDAPAGFRLSGGRIPAGRDRLWMTLSAPREPLDRPAALQLEGVAQAGEETIRRPVVPAEDMMQAFAYRHLAPSRELLVAVGPRRAGPPVEIVNRGPVRIPVGGAGYVRIRCPRGIKIQNLTFELCDPPEGLSLGSVAAVPEGLSIQLKADGGKAKAGLADNLIIEAFGQARSASGRKGPQAQRFSMGVLPAVPFEVVQR